ncbi:Bug family tripartite tricarboxylate transporter substrate binding protein [Paracraurococcus lichenis]|uniref:Tripartite tricarboxylate transporter substrate binding protein n=1 Tax=Paracraurococcus lichenis TaxID=3064888 RepID=A0ABT9E8Z3_9PROT|nr:tripartite tricarboxylate transporter substrate binding protein [Paracraurococcus sp. LOR1-02]MDO9712663.1 tripartite tricarboxylate transporter substrate binding protein [Paracraurococcus sp. LOR1-02]
MSQRLSCLRLSRRALLAALAAPSVARAQDYPDRPLRLIVPFGPGGTVDLVGRLVGNRLSQTIGQPVVIENRGGASGAIGSVAAARAAPDGYTFLVGSTTTISIYPQLEPNAGYDPARDFIGLSQAAYVPHVLVINPQIPATSIAELLAWTKARREPLALGDGGVGTPHSLAGEILAQAAGIEVLHVTYKGGGEAHAALIAGTVNAASVELSVASPYMRNGQMRAVGIAARERAPGFPDLPTFIEQGFPDYEITSWFGFFAPSHTPEAIAARLEEAVVRATLDPEVKDKLTAAGATVVGSGRGPFEAHLARERAKWGAAIRLAGVTATN